MKVRELRELLEDYSDDVEVLFKPTNSYYLEGLSDMAEKKDVSRFYGGDFKALAILSDGQVGTAC